MSRKNRKVALFILLVALSITALIKAGQFVIEAHNSALEANRAQKEFADKVHECMFKRYGSVHLGFEIYRTKELGDIQITHAEACLDR